MHQLFNQTLHRQSRTHHHNERGEDERGPVHQLNSPRVHPSKHPQMHHCGEHKRSNHIAEVSDDAQNVLKEGHEIRHQRDAHDLHDSEHDIHRVRDEVLTLRARAPVSLDHLVHRLHPQRESADHRDHHQQIHRDREPRAVRERLQDVALHAVR